MYTERLNSVQWMYSGLMCRVEVLLMGETPRHVAQDGPRKRFGWSGRGLYRPDRGERPRGSGNDFWRI